MDFGILLLLLLLLIIIIMIRIKTCKNLTTLLTSLALILLHVSCKCGSILLTYHEISP
jgi:hypothetical protein